MAEASDGPTVHIIPLGAKPGETVRALCGVTFTVERIHGSGTSATTCEGCAVMSLR